MSSRKWHDGQYLLHLGIRPDSRAIDVDGHALLDAVTRLREFEHGDAIMQGMLNSWGMGRASPWVCGDAQELAVRVLSQSPLTFSYISLFLYLKHTYIRSPSVSLLCQSLCEELLNYFSHPTCSTSS